MEVSVLTETALVPTTDSLSSIPQLEPPSNYPLTSPTQYVLMSFVHISEST
jgi:hypothetical protein